MNTFNLVNNSNERCTLFDIGEMNCEIVLCHSTILVIQELVMWFIVVLPCMDVNNNGVMK